jgi:hypothetical protein
MLIFVKKMIFLYNATRNNQKIGGVLQARHSFEALHNARIEVMQRGGNIREMLLAKIG